MVKRNKLEIDHELDFVDEMIELGYKAEKFKIEGKKGAYDRIVFCPGGITIFVEFKRTPKDDRSEHQIKFGKDMEKLGFDTFVASDCKSAVEFVKMKVRYRLGLRLK